MRPLPCTNARVAGVFVMLWLVAGGMMAPAQAARFTTALTADQTTACIQAATTAQAGMITYVDVKEKGGTRLWRVGIMDAQGKKYTLRVDVQTNRVVQAK